MLLLGGLRIGESAAVRWGDLDLAAGRHGRVRVRAGKTDAAERTVDIGPLLHDYLATYKPADAPREKLVFTKLDGQDPNRPPMGWSLRRDRRGTRGEPRAGQAR